MKYKININYNISQSPITNSTRTAYIRHDRREYSYYKNRGLNQSLSKYNAYYNMADYRKIMCKNLIPYIRHHNNLSSVKSNPRRKITSVHKFLQKRGSKIPYKFAVLKLGTINDKKKLIQLFEAKGYGFKEYAKAVNNAFYKYGKDYNESHKHLAYDNIFVHNDEYGSSHAHLGIISTAKTASGKVSLSFDRGTKCEYKGHTNKASWIKMQKYEATQFLKYATKSFQKYLGMRFHFQLSRNPSHNNHLEHNEYIKLARENDRLKKALKLGDWQASELTNVNKGYLKDINILSNWKRRAIKILKMAYTGAVIGKSLEREVKQYHLKIVPKLTELEQNNEHYDQIFKQWKINPKLIQVADTLVNLPKGYVEALETLSHQSSLTLIKSIRAYLKTKN